MDANSFLKSISQQVAPQGQPAAGGSGKTQLQFSVPCYEVDYEQRKAPSFKYIFYDLPFPQLPQYVSFHIVNGWIGGKGPGMNQVIKILQPDGSLHLETGRQPLEFVDEHTPFLAINRFPDIPFEKVGHYWIVVYLEDQEVLRYPISSRDVGWEAYGEAAGEMKARYEAEMAERAAHRAASQQQQQPPAAPNPFGLGS